MLLLAFSNNERLYALHFAQRIRFVIAIIPMFRNFRNTAFYCLLYDLLFNHFILSSHSLVIYLVFVFLKHSRAEWPWTVIPHPLSFHVLALHKSLSIQHFSSQTTYSIKQQIRAKTAMKEMYIFFWSFGLLRSTAVVYLYQLCSLRSRTIKSERDCSNYAMSGQHRVSPAVQW